MKTMRIGSGAGYSGDRIEPAVELVEKGDIAYLCFECLAERTIAIGQQARLVNPKAGYDALLEARMRAVLPQAKAKGVKIITNMGAANPEAGAAKIAEVARDLGLKNVKIAAVGGDDVLAALVAGDYPITETGRPVSEMKDTLVSANAYLGVAPIVEALRGGADVIITGRVADPALFLAPLIHEFGWAMDDWDKLGKGTAVGHLLECAGQVTGGYFADPDVKDVADLARLGFPIAEVGEDGSIVITKVSGSGGRVTTATCKEQLLYEIHDPKAYFTPDVIADFSHIAVSEDGFDRVRVSGATGRPRPETLKVSVGYKDGFIGEGQMSYAGGGAVKRGRLALAIVEERLKLTGVKTTEQRFDLIGVDSIHGPVIAEGAADPHEVRIRVVGRTESLAEAVKIGNEVETLYTNGPAGGGGATKSARAVVAMLSALLPRDRVVATVEFLEV
ncbi:MAG TPA: acyclic terpene utilization AtuA family protein [Telmatospirillum sp.]|nr:acyclic terpene utilization AtuA family protein [Telmatospirillum sp.]